MNDYLKLLLKEVRSGKYRKGQCFLRTKDDKFCFFGVAMHLFHTGSCRLDGKFYVYDGELTCMVTVKVNDLLGFAGLGGKPKPCYDSHDYPSIYSLNDDGWTFDEIADWIEKHEEVYLV